jgi:hypothetical protein
MHKECNTRYSVPRTPSCSSDADGEPLHDSVPCFIVRTAQHASTATPTQPHNQAQSKKTRPRLSGHTASSILPRPAFPNVTVTNTDAALIPRGAEAIRTHHTTPSSTEPAFPLRDHHHVRRSPGSLLHTLPHPSIHTSTQAPSLCYPISQNQSTSLFPANHPSITAKRTLATSLPIQPATPQ